MAKPGCHKCQPEHHLHTLSPRAHASNSASIPASGITHFPHGAGWPDGVESYPKGVDVGGQTQTFARPLLRAGPAWGEDCPCAQRQACAVQHPAQAHISYLGLALVRPAPQASECLGPVCSSTAHALTHLQKAWQSCCPDWSPAEAWAALHAAGQEPRHSSQALCLGWLGARAAKVLQRRCRP